MKKTDCQEVSTHVWFCLGLNEMQGIMSATRASNDLGSSSRHKFKTEYVD